jgi:uncharacterized membrane protein
MKQQIPPHQQHQEERQRFQVERMILFTDAVFAIAITLLILEIKVPNLDENGLNSAKILNFLLDGAQTWIGFIISFWVIALYWIDHHRVFAYVDDYDGKLVFFNLFFLMSIAIMPFTSALYSKYFGYNFPLQLYCFNIALTGFIKLRLLYYIINPKNKISHYPMEQVRKRYYIVRSWSTPLIFLATGFLASYTMWSRMFFLAVFIVKIIIGKYFEKKHGLKERFK